MHRQDGPRAAPLLAAPLRVVNGEIAMPQGPGLGIELNEDTVARYSLPADSPLPDGNYSDMVFGRSYYAPAAPYESGK